jgi:hypothetical protein
VDRDLASTAIRTLAANAGDGSIASAASSSFIGSSNW